MMNRIYVVILMLLGNLLVFPAILLAPSPQAMIMGTVGLALLTILVECSWED